MFLITCPLSEVPTFYLFGVYSQVTRIYFYFFIFLFKAHLFVFQQGIRRFHFHSPPPQLLTYAYFFFQVDTFNLVSWHFYYLKFCIFLFLVLLKNSWSLSEQLILFSYLTDSFIGRNPTTQSIFSQHLKALLCCFLAFHAAVLSLSLHLLPHDL